MIKNWLITGDTHGWIEERLTNIDTTKYVPAETAIIILGDAGINFYLNKTDKKHKIALQKTGFIFYCVRGNHEERPENILSYYQIYDKEVQNDVWIQDDYPNLRFFIDGFDYMIKGYRCLVVGGAYSVDKWYRIQGKDTSKWTGWFADEQLTQTEMNNIYNTHHNEHFDFVLTHTCPIDWEPTDLFLTMVDQSLVDKTMENWMATLRDSLDYGIWCFGHYHADRLERPHVEMYYHNIDEIDDIYNRWQKYDTNNELDWWLPKSPHFYWA